MSDDVAIEELQKFLQEFTALSHKYKIRLAMYDGDELPRLVPMSTGDEFGKYTGMLHEHSFSDVQWETPKIDFPVGTMSSRYAK